MKGNPVFNEMLLEHRGIKEDLKKDPELEDIKQKIKSLSSAEEDDYRIQHQAPEPENGAPMWDLRGIYPEDVYENAAKWYSSGSDFDHEAAAVIRSARGRRDKQIKVYRAVPKSVSAINRGDWVTITRGYAKEHAESLSTKDEKYKIISKSVQARDLFSDGNSIQEWGYYPQPFTPRPDRDQEWEKWPGKIKSLSSVKSFEEALQIVKDNEAKGDVYHGFLPVKPAVEKELRGVREKILKNGIFRGVRAKDKESINLKRVGIFWSWDKEHAVSYWGDTKDTLFTISADVTDKDIDWVATIEQFLKPQYAEDEVRLFKNATPKITKIEEYGSWWKKDGSSWLSQTDKSETTSANEEGSLDDIVQELVDSYFPDLETKPVVTLVDFIDCVAKTNLRDDGTVDIQVNNQITDQKIIRQILAHELIHCLIYQKFGKEAPKHGEEFNKRAAVINEKEGKDYITPLANDTEWKN